MKAQTIKTERPFKRSLSALWTLTVMQLKEKMDVAYLRSFRQTLFRVIFFVLEFAAITAICFLLFWAAQMLKVFDMSGAIPSNVLVLVFTVMLGLSTVFTTAGLVKSLYLSRDNLVLLTFPATPAIVFLSKLLVYYVYELKKNFFFLIPFFCAYGIAQGYAAYFYPWVIIWFAFIAAVPVLLAALLSMPALYIYQTLQKVPVVKYTLITITFAGLILFAYYLISLIPENINFLETWSSSTFWEIKGFLESFQQVVLPLTWLTTLLIGKTDLTGHHQFTSATLPVSAGLIGSIILLTVLCFELSQPLFYKMASTPFEYTKNMKAKARPNKKAQPFLSAIKKEWMVALRDGTVTSLVTQLIVVMPLAIALLNSLYEAMNTKFIGLQMTVCFNLLIVLLFMLSANIRISSAYSKDGFSAYLNKVQPSTYGSLLFAKLTVNLVMGLFGVALTTFTYGVFGAIGITELILFAVTVYALYVAHLFWSGEMDIMNPQYTQYATFSEQSNNPNENKSSVLAFALSFLIAGGMLLLSFEDASIVWYKVAAVAVVIAAVKIYTYFLKIKVYYKEK